MRRKKKGRLVLNVACSEGWGCRDAVRYAYGGMTAGMGPLNYYLKKQYENQKTEGSFAGGVIRYFNKFELI